MAKKNLLLCFDAFGTLFKPKWPIPKQYAEVARQCGLAGLSDDQLQDSFVAAFKAESKAHPNYGRSAGNMGPQKWWTNVIHNTFQPLLAPGQQIPADLPPSLLCRFSSADGYSLLDPQLPTLLSALRDPYPLKTFNKVVVGVITNSDDRVPDILSSLGLNVSCLRYGHGGASELGPAVSYHIDFHCMSYDVGSEKPHKEIFAAAEKMLQDVIVARKWATRANARHDGWVKIYVGDEYQKDIVGASNAGWNPVLLVETQEDHIRQPRFQQLADVLSHQGLDAFTPDRVVTVDSVRKLVEWLIGRQVK